MQFSYLYQLKERESNSAEMQEPLVYSRHCLAEHDHLNWLKGPTDSEPKLTDSIDARLVMLHTNRMEEPPMAAQVLGRFGGPGDGPMATEEKEAKGTGAQRAPVFVDFANEQLHIGHLIPSLTQGAVSARDEQ